MWTPGAKPSLRGSQILFPKVVELLKENGSDDIKVFGGGIIPQEDIPVLQGQGIRALFVPGTSTEDIVGWIKENITPRE